MMKALLRLRFQALFAGMTRQGRRKNDTKKSSGKGTAVLLAVLYLYVAVILCGFMGFLFWSLAEPYHAMGLDWLYFAMSGTMALGFCILGSVFTTQNQLYDAKDNFLLLSMPIPPAKILLSRMLPLMALNLVFAGIVMLPAIAVYSVVIRFDLWLILAQLLSLILVVLLAQAFACILGWGLHLLLSRMNKSVASIVYTVLFLAIYFSIYPRMNEILASMAASGEAIAGSLKAWVWPMYAMGQGVLGKIPYLLAFAAICIAVFALIYWLLSVTFLRTATARHSSKRAKLNMSGLKAGTAAQALVRKELRRFLGCPVYLTNMGIGLIMVPALAIAGVIFRDTLLSELGEALPLLQPYIPMAICGILVFTASMIGISAPSVSLEGKNLWILQALPVEAKQILRAKLNFHCMMSVPVAALAGCVLSIAYGCSLPGIALCTVIPAAVMVFNGLLGLIANLKWPRFDWISEAYPCKQAAPVAIVMFGVMGLPVVFGIVYFLLAGILSPAVYLGICAGVLALSDYALYRLLMSWGTKKWMAL